MKVTINDDGSIKGYLTVSEYAKSIGTTSGNVRIMIRRGQLSPLSIIFGDLPEQRVNFIKDGTPKPTRTNKKEDFDVESNSNGN